MASKNTGDDFELVPDPVVARQLGVTLMTIWRWDNRAKTKTGFPPRIKIGQRNYRSKRELKAWLDNLRPAKKAVRP